MRNLHRINGAVFQHEKPGLCALCAHRRDYGDWQGFCELRNKVLSAAKDYSKTGRCSGYKASEATQ